MDKELNLLKTIKSNYSSKEVEQEAREKCDILTFLNYLQVRWQVNIKKKSLQKSFCKLFFDYSFGTPKENRTPVSAVRGQRPNR